MKKILFTVLALLLVICPCFCFDLTTFEVRETFIKNGIKYGIYNKKYGHFAFKGVWASNIANRIMLEEVFCNYENYSCSSSLSETSFLGTPILNPLIDVYMVYYKIIDENGNKYKLYSPDTGYTIEIDLANKTATKYKIFDNGDVNKYTLLLDDNSIKNYIETKVIPDQKSFE